MDYIGEYSQRKVYWLDYDKFSSEELPDKDWICLAEANNVPDIENFDNFARTAFNNGILEFKGHGTFGEKLHDLFDETIVMMKIEKDENLGNQADFENSPMTTWHNNQTLADTFWQCFFVTSLPDTADHNNIKIVCTDLDKVDRRKELKNYLDKFAEGWLP